MALPTLQPFWLKNYKNTSEALMVKRNQDQNEFRQKWDKNSQFFKRSEVEAVKQTGWTSNESYQRSMDKIGEVYKRSTKQVELERRKNLLAEMLCKETESFERELRDKRLSKAGNLLEMRDRADELKEAREERRKQLAEEKLYEHWKENEPELRKVQSSQMQKHVITGWGEQVTEREDIKKTARDEERRLDHMMELNQLREIEKERKKAEQKKEEEVQLKSELLKQMEQLKMKEEEGQMLKREEEDLEKHKMIVDAAEEKRRQFDEQRRKQEYGRVLVRQYKAQLRRKSKQVQDALELDLKILEDLSRQGKDEIAVKTSRREKARADAEEMRKVVAEQLKLEKAREAELDMMYQEEAARQWQKRESEWERERIARERLMKEVLDERQKQLDNRMQVVLRKKEESIADREELIRKMENHQKYIEEEREEEIFRKKEREREINEQITSRTERQRDHALREQQLLEQKRREEEAYKRMLESEIGGMTAREETPRMQSKIPSEECLSLWIAADAVCFDVDSTVITGEGLDDLADFCGCGEEVAKWTSKAMGEGISFRESLEVRLNIFKPRKSKVEAFLEANPPTLTANVRELVSMLASRGVAVYLISGGFHAIVDHVANQLGIPLERVFANRLQFDEQGEYSGFDKEEPTSESHGKARVVENLKTNFKHKSVIMIGDGMTDLEAYPPADLFIGFGANKTRPNVLEKAPWFVYNFQSLIDALTKDETASDGH